MKGLEQMRKIVAKLEDTREGAHHGSTAFYVGKQLFATCGDKEGIVVGLEPEHAATLVDRDPRFKAYPRAKHAVMFDPGEIKDFAELVRESYAIAKAPKPKKRRK